jgi:CYTH domain-containing protein
VILDHHGGGTTLIEIERRFLVSDPEAALAAVDIDGPYQISQGYFGRVDGLRLRIRITTDASGASNALLTLKGPRQGACRVEYGWPVALRAARQALRTLPASGIIRKHRYHRRYDNGVVWSIDFFQGINAGLVLAEVELCRPDQFVEFPDWLGAEVTSERRYGNSSLARRPTPAFACAA